MDLMWKEMIACLSLLDKLMISSLMIKIPHLNNLIERKKMFFGLIPLVMVGMMDLILLWVNTLKAKKI